VYKSAATIKPIFMFYCILYNSKIGHQMLIQSQKWLLGMDCGILPELKYVCRGGKPVKPFI
jgi:hypothetical protein